MASKDEALKMAIELMERFLEHDGISSSDYIDVLEACKEALEQEPLNLNCKSVQKRLATQWGYIEQPSQEPIEWMLLKPEDRESLCKLLMMLKGLGHHSTPPPAPSCKCEECGMKYCECGERK